MKIAQQVVFGLLGLAFVFILTVAGGYALHRATYHPSLYTPPPASERKSTVQMVREAKNLNGLKQICEFWAKSEDQIQAFTTFQLERFETLTKTLAIVLGSLGVIFTVGLLYVYLVLRRVQSKHANAL